MTARPGTALLALLLLAGATATAAAVPAPSTTPATTDDATTTLSGPVAAQSGETNRSERQDDGAAPSDPAEDTLGWEDGVWYNESIAVTPGDGYNETELERIVARSMARVERIRGLEFESTPDVELITREEYRALVESLYADVGNVTTAKRLHQNTKFEALYLVGEDDSYYADFVANQGSVASAFHVNEDVPEHGFEEGDVGIVVSEDGAATELQEWTLGHELLHYVQNRRFDNSAFQGGPTEEAATVNRSLLEGDATYVGQTYARRCSVEWDCLPASRGAAPGFENFGLVLYGFAPYSNTAVLFEHVREQGGVAAMNALYERPPASTEQFLHPEDYPDDEPLEVRVADRSTDAWERLSLPDGSANATFGEAGIFVALYYPSYDRESTVAIDFQHPFDGARRDPLVRLDYVHPASTGWEGDTLVVYTTDRSPETNETAYVWRSVWESPADAREFADAYAQVVAAYGDPVDAGAGGRTYRIPDTHRFGDAVHVSVDGDTVTVVNAPTLENLSAVHSGVVTETTTRTTRTTTATTATTADPTTSPTTTVPTTDDRTTTDGEAQPGFGLVAALLALGGVLVLALRRRS